MQKHQEKTLVAAIREGNTQAFEQVYAAFLTPIYRFILFKVSRRQDAEDLSAEVFLRAWQYLYHQQRPIEHLSAFLYQIARNIVIDFYRQRSQDGIALQPQAAETLADEKQQQLFLRVESAVELAGIERAVRTLKDEYKEVVLLRYVEELTVAEIATIMGRSKGAVRVMVFRALQVLRGQVVKPNPSGPANPSLKPLLSDQPTETTLQPPNL